MKMACLCGFVLVCLTTAGLAQEVVEGPAVVRSNNAFAMDLYARLKDKPGNIFFSPFSIATALTMTYAGARGNTAQEMAQVLHLDPADDTVHQALAGELERLRRIEGCELIVANALWGQEGYVFLPDFLAVLKDDYGSELNQIDFMQSRVAAGIINTWVSDTTRERIRDLVTPEMLAEARLVLVNAIYFKGAWVSPFKKINTQNRHFYKEPDVPAVVPMMNQRAVFMYAEDGMVQVLDLPYAGGELSMMVILPRKLDGLQELEGILNVEDYKTWVKALTRREVDVTLPRFRNVSTFGLVEVLGGMGMAGAFTLAADFSGISLERELYIKDVVHKAFLDVNEEGSEAAAATAVLMQEKGVLAEPLSRAVAFVADHPYIYLIRDCQTDAILFMGRAQDPEVAPRQVGDVLGGMLGEVIGQAFRAQATGEQGP